MTILDILIVVMLIMVVILGAFLGIVRIFGFLLALGVAITATVYLVIPLFNLVRPFFAANELYGQVTSFIAIFAFTTLAIRAMYYQIEKKRGSDLSAAERLTGGILLVISSMLLSGFLFFLNAAFFSTCNQANQTCPSLIQWIEEQGKNSFMILFLKNITKIVFNIFI
ncbi:MAG: CvpA family protein [bacterium]